MPSYISNIQVPPTITMSEHVAAHDPHPKYLLAENLVSSINVQVSLEDLNNILIEENAELNNTVLVHNSGSWEPVSVSTLLVSAIPYATTENSGTVKLAVDEDIASKNTATVVTPNLLYPYFTRYDSAINELSSRADSAVTRIPVATESLPGIARLATSNDVNNNTDSTIVTPPLLNEVSRTLSASIDLKQNVLTAGAMIDATALDNNTVEVTGAQPMLEEHGMYTSIVTTLDTTVDPPLTKYRVDVVEPLANVPDDLDTLTEEFHEHEHSTEAHSELIADLLENAAHEGKFIVTDEAAGYALIPVNEKYNLVVQWGYISSNRFVAKSTEGYSYSVDYKVKEDFTYPLHYVISVTFSPDKSTQSILLDKYYSFTDPAPTEDSTAFNRFLDNTVSDPYSDEELLTNNIDSFVCVASKEGSSGGGTSWMSLGIAVNTDVTPNTLFVAWMPPHLEYSSSLLKYANRKTYPIGIDEYQIIPIIAVEANRTDRWYAADYLQTITDVIDGSFSCNANILEESSSFKNRTCFDSTWAVLGKMKSLADYRNANIKQHLLGTDNNYYYNFLPISLDHCSIEKVDKNTTSIKIRISPTQSFIIQSGVVVGTTANKDIHWLDLPTPLDELLHADFSVRAYTSSADLPDKTERNVYWNYSAKCHNDSTNTAYAGKICAISFTSLGYYNITNKTYYNKKHQIQWVVYGIVNEENTDYVEDAIYDSTNKYLSLPVNNNYRFKFNWGSLVYRLGKITPSPDSEAGYVATNPYSNLDEYNGVVLTISGNSVGSIPNAPVVGQTQQLYRYFVRFYEKMYHCNETTIPSDRVIKCGITQIQWKETYNSENGKYDDFFVTGYVNDSNFVFDNEFSADTSKKSTRTKHQMKYATQDVSLEQYRQDVEKNNYAYQLFLDRTHWSDTIPAYSEVCIVHNYGGSGTNGSGCITNLSWMMIIVTDRLYETPSFPTKSSVLTWTVHSFGYNDPNYNGLNPRPWQNIHSDNANVSRYTTTVTKDNNTNTSVSTLTKNTAANDITVDTISDNNNLNRVISDSNQRCDYAYNLPGKVISMYVDSTNCDLGTTNNGTHIDEPYSSSKVYWYIRRDTEKEELDPNGYYTLNGVYLHMLGIRGTSVSNAIMIYFEDDTKIKIQNGIITIKSLHVKFNNGGNDAGKYDINFTSSKASKDPETSGFSLLSVHTNTGGEDTYIAVTIQLTTGGDILIDARCNVHVITNRVCYSEIMTTYCDTTSSTEEFIRIPAVYNYEKVVEKESSK